MAVSLQQIIKQATIPNSKLWWIKMFVSTEAFDSLSNTGDVKQVPLLLPWCAQLTAPSLFAPLWHMIIGKLRSPKQTKSKCHDNSYSRGIHSPSEGRCMPVTCNVMCMTWKHSWELLDIRSPLNHAFKSFNWEEGIIGILLSCMLEISPTL